MILSTYDFDMKQNSAILETPLRVVAAVYDRRMKTIPAVIDSRYKPGSHRQPLQMK